MGGHIVHGNPFSFRRFFCLSEGMDTAPPPLTPGTLYLAASLSALSAGIIKNCVRFQPKIAIAITREFAILINPLPDAEESVGKGKRP
jgi:hypothetical protein